MKRSALTAILPPIPDRLVPQATIEAMPPPLSLGTMAGPQAAPRLPARMPRATTAPGLHPYAVAAAPTPSARPVTQVQRPMMRPATQVRMPRCEVCNAAVGELRRGRCWGCYSRWVDARPVGAGARCITCGEKRRRVLKNVELFGGWKPMCFNCAGQVLNLDPMPTSIASLRVAVSRERRGTDRRVGKADTRVFQYERRVGDRRAARADGLVASHNKDLEDDMIIEITIDPLLATSDDSVDFDDLTQIRELVRELRPE
ncbi:MAG: hypothetical protein NT062_29920 [Proteobacteria bacterium]|nr:hypothetical protein [Pseudomonadota bacterium]